MRVMLWVMSNGGVATAGTYAESAHGDPTFGVNRSTACDALGHYLWQIDYCDRVALDENKSDEKT